MGNEEKNEMLEKITSRLESIYIVYANTANDKIHWKTEWYRALYGIFEEKR